MFAKDRQEHRLIIETPISLAALTRHEINPEEEGWFARCKGDFLRSFPTSLLELTRLILILWVLGEAASGPFKTFNISMCLTGVAAQTWVRMAERDDGFDQRVALKWRGWIACLRGGWWAIATFWALLLVPPEAQGELTALVLATMAIDGISATTLPWLALGVSVVQGLALVAGLLFTAGVGAGKIVPIVLLMVTFLHWSIFNFYYMFSTRRIRTKRLSQSNETIRLLLNQYDDEGSDWLYEIDAEGCIHNPSSRFCAASGLGFDILDGLPLTALLADDAGAAELAECLTRHESFRALTVSLLVHGDERWWSISGRPVTQADGSFAGWRGFVADITEARRAEVRVAWLAHYDVLTGLCNRSSLQANLDRMLSRCGAERTIAVLYLDLDRFKEINDGLGHDAGDTVLIEVARRLEAVVRPRDLVARLGGDEFVIVADGQDARTAYAMAERILEALAAPIAFGEHACHVGGSIGIAVAPDDAQSVADLLRAADVAMYNAKSGGRQRAIVFDPVMETQLRERRGLELELRAAIRNGQLLLHYQPLLDLTSGETTGYEALLRWDHPERGIIAPDLFVPIAEETGLIVDIGRWVIREALAEAGRWQDHLSVAVNLSPVQMRDPALKSTILNALSASGVVPNRLELEITESTLLQDSEDTMTLLHQLRALGIRIALDDFGTGYSSLNYLRSFPFDKIKIDRCFISELSSREDCQAIVRSVVALASELNMVTTAEGVEAFEQLEALRANGCNQAQGYLFSQAVPAAQLVHHAPAVIGSRLAG